MDEAEIRRQRAALQSEIDNLLKVLTLLTEIENVETQIHEHDDFQLADAGGAVLPSDNAAGSLLLQHRDPVSVAPGDQQDTGYLYPFLGAPVMESGDDIYPLMNHPLHDSEHPIQWEHHLYDQAAYDTFGQPPATDGAAGQLQETGEEAAGSGEDHGGGGYHLLSDPALYNEDLVAARLHVLISNGEATPVRFSDGGFGGVPASAAAIAGLKKHKYDGSGADGGGMCVICMRGFKKGKRLYAMPCAYMHRFHRKCLKRWLSRSNVCPLCRHALPTEDQEAVHTQPQQIFDVN